MYIYIYVLIVIYIYVDDMYIYREMGGSNNANV